MACVICSGPAPEPLAADHLPVCGGCAYSAGQIVAHQIVRLDVEDAIQNLLGDGQQS